MQPEEILIKSILDAQPESVLWFKPVWESSNQTDAPSDFEYRYCNKAAALMFGSSPETVVGQRLRSTVLLDAETRAIAYQQCLGVFQSGEQMEITYYNKSLGKYFNVLRSKVLDGVITVIRDKTEKVIAEQELQQQATLLNSILDASQNAVFACEAIRDQNNRIADLKFIKYNRKFLEVTGLSKETLRDKNYLEIFPNAKSPGGPFELNCKVIESGEPVVTELYYKGDQFNAWFEVSLVKLGQNGLVVSFTDITQAKKDKQAIEESAQYLQQAIDSSQTGITVIVPEFDNNGEIIDFRYRVVNQTFSMFIGVTPEQMTGGRLSQWFPLYKAQGTFDRYKKIFLTGEPDRFDLHYVNNGYDVWVDILAKKNGDEIMVTFHDYSTLKNAQLKLEVLVNDLKRSNTNLEDFAYAASHDLQEPLRKIHFFAEKIKSKYISSLDEEGKSMFSRMETATQRMRELIDDLLTYTQVEKKAVQVEKVDLNEIISEILSDLEPVIQEKKAQVTSDILPTIKGDRPQLRQLLQNLVSNSLKYTTEERSPFVSLRSIHVTGRESGFVLPTEELNKTFHLIQVTDNGIGFEQENAEKIFNVFQRLHSRAEYSGTGLGLAIAKKSVDNHNGFIMAEGRPGEGACFKILLPLHS